MGLTDGTKTLLEAIAENNQLSIYQAALKVCAEDTTQKNYYYTRKYSEIFQQKLSNYNQAETLGFPGA